jgi:hypothetical protein
MRLFVFIDLLGTLVVYVRSVACVLINLLITFLACLLDCPFCHQSCGYSYCHACGHVWLSIDIVC